MVFNRYPSWLVFLSLWANVVLFSCSSEAGKAPIHSGEAKVTRLDILPFKGIPDADIAAVESAVETYYGFEVEVLDQRSIPRAYYINMKSPRYRADSILRYLAKARSVEVPLILGLTHQDISTTKYGPDGKVKQPRYKYEDWGIFGLGSVGGGVCVVSNHRLGRKVGPKKKTERMQKVALHEVGHALGLPHCPDQDCFMRDAAEKMSTVDQVKMSLCSECKQRIGMD